MDYSVYTSSEEKVSWPETCKTIVRYTHIHTPYKGRRIIISSIKKRKYFGSEFLYFTHKR